MSATVKWDAKPAQALLKRAAAALDDAGEYLLEEANRTIPIEEGTLIGSGAVELNAKALTVKVGYDTPYAMRQHEDTRLHHDAGRRAKWLERTFTEQASRVLAFLADKMRRGH